VKRGCSPETGLPDPVKAESFYQLVLFVQRAKVINRGNCYAQGGIEENERQAELLKQVPGLLFAKLSIVHRLLL